HLTLWRTRPTDRHTLRSGARGHRPERSRPAGRVHLHPAHRHRGGDHRRGPLHGAARGRRPTVTQIASHPSPSPNSDHSKGLAPMSSVLTRRATSAVVGVLALSLGLAACASPKTGTADATVPAVTGTP